MRNFYEQRKTCNSVIFATLFLLIYLLFTLGIYSIMFLPPVGGYFQHDYYAETMPDVAKNGSRLICVTIPAEDFNLVELEGQPIIFYVKDADGNKVASVGKYVDYQYGYLKVSTGTDFVSEYVVAREDIAARVVAVLPYVGTISRFYTSVVGMAANAVAAVVVLGSFVTYYRLRRKVRRKYADPGINIKKLSPEDAYIYAKLKEFLSNNRFEVTDAADCTLAYIIKTDRKTKERQRNLFCKIMYQNGSMYVVINAPNNNRKFVDRSNYIRIERAVHLDSGFDRIKQAYRRHFATDNK